jgi:hypothetical protein
VEGLGAEYRGDSGSERSAHSFFFAETAPMNDSRSAHITNLSISNLVNSHFLDERRFDFHFLDNDFHFLNNRYGQARLRMHFLDNAFCAWPSALVGQNDWEWSPVFVNMMLLLFGWGSRFGE